MAVELGDRAKDTISGGIGIVIGISEWLYGCRRITIQPEKAKDGKPEEMFTVDEPQVKITKKGAVENVLPDAKTPRKHGPRPETRRRDIRRR
jgi:hypothetical protein